MSAYVKTHWKFLYVNNVSLKEKGVVWRKKKKTFLRESRNILDN